MVQIVNVVNCHCTRVLASLCHKAGEQTFTKLLGKSLSRHGRLPCGVAQRRSCNSVYVLSKCVSHVQSVQKTHNDLQSLGSKNTRSEMEPHVVYILNSECSLFEFRADSDHSSSFIIIIIHHASCVMCHASCVMTCWRPSMRFSHSNPKLHLRSELTQPQPHSYGFLRRLYYSFFITL